MKERLPINPPPIEIGRSNVVMAGSSRFYEVEDFEGSLSIKTVVSGSAVWRAGARRFVVNENCWLVLNDRQHYSMRIDSAEKTTTFCLFFERGVVEDIWRTFVTPQSELLENGDSDLREFGFFETLEPKRSRVLKKVRSFQRAIAQAEVSREQWEEWFVHVGAALVAAQRNVFGRAEKLAALKASTRIELCRRVLRGRDMLLSSSAGFLPLKLLAREACMSPYHFHRTFRQLFGVTPHEMLTRYRLERAAQRLSQTEERVMDIALQNGFESLPSFSGLFRKRYGVSPREFRRQNRTAPAIRKLA